MAKGKREQVVTVQSCEHDRFVEWVKVEAVALGEDGRVKEIEPLRLSFNVPMSRAASYAPGRQIAVRLTLK